MDVKLKLGQRIKELREAKNMSQKDLAYAADLDRSYIASIENGQRNVSIVNIEKITMAMGINLNEFLKESLIKDVVDEYGEKFTEATIVINIRSQISSIQKNFDTLYERTTSEAINLHDRCPKMCLGEVYMIAVPEYDDKEIKNKK